MDFYYKGSTIDIDTGGSVYDWTGKKIVFFGDSITDGLSGYLTYVSNALGATGVNKANSGLSVFPDWYSYKDREGVDERHLAADFRRQPSNIPVDVDLLVITGDVNSNSVDGTYNDTGKSSWYGRYNDALTAIHTSFPEVPVLLISEYCMAKNNTNYQVAEAMRQVSEYMGCPYLNLQNESQLNLKWSTVFGQTSSDHTHVNATYMPLFADFVIEKIKRIKPFAFSGESTLSIDKSTVTVAVDDTETITATTTGDHSVLWTSSDYDVACVMGGIVIGMSAGSATITATTRDGKTSTCSVTVTA